MSLTSSVKSIFKYFFNIKQWLDYNNVKNNGGHIKDAAKTFFTPKKGTRKESFEEAISRMGLTEKDVVMRMREFSNLFWIFLLLTLAVFGYMIYSLFNGHFIASLGSFGVACFALSQAFRYHFWCFQLKSRRLGVTFKEWLEHGLLGKKQ